MKLKGIICEMRRQPLLSAVSIVGTALAIFLLMTVVMMQHIKVADLRPESNRHRTLYNKYVCASSHAGAHMRSGAMSVEAARQLFEGVDGVETVGLYSSWLDEVELATPGQAPLMAAGKQASSTFFDVMDYEFVSGGPITAADEASGQHVAVISEDVARSLFGTADAANRQVLVNRTMHRVVGVVRPVSRLLTVAYAQVWTPIPELAAGNVETESGANAFFGDYHLALLADDAASIPGIKAGVASRYATANDMLRADSIEVMYYGGPFTVSEAEAEASSNLKPDLEGHRMANIALYAILLIVPAINLSSMTQSRMRQRISEVGIKRAFGCTRLRLMVEMLAENLVYTVAGGIIGLVLSLVAAWLMGSMFLASYGWDDIISTEGFGSMALGLNPLSLLSWSTMGWALAFCLVLNLLSAGVPTFMAARVAPVQAISRPQ